MKVYTINVEATFAFDITAGSEEEAKDAARKMLKARDPINDSHGGLNDEYRSPWIAVAGADEDFPALEATDAFPYE